MKFLCIPCDEQMETQKKGLMMTEDNKNITLQFKCKKCGHSIAMLTNKFETEFVSKLGVEAGGPSEFGTKPMGMVSSSLSEGKAELKAAEPSDEGIEWTQEATDRIQKVPFFVRGMAKKTVIGFAKSKGIKVIDGPLMDEVRDKVGM